jgi:hypothetical protein
MNPQSNYRGQHAREKDVQAMLELRLPSERPGTAARSSFSFTVAKVGRRAGCLPDGAGVIRLAANQRAGANQEHQDRVVKEVHVHEPAKQRSGKVPSFVHYFERKA